MSNVVHSISVADASDPLSSADRLEMVLKKAVAYGAGSGAGASVAVAVSGLRLPASYAVFVGSSADATAYVTNQTNSGFTLNVSPRLAANTLAAGSMSLLILA